MISRFYKRSSLLAGALLLTALSSLPIHAQGPTVPVTTASSTPILTSEPHLLSHQIPNPEPPQGVWSRPRLTVTMTDTPPALDGKIEDECWKTATHATGFFRFTGSAPVTQQTEAWLCADKRFLYVAFHCLDSEPGRIRTSETQRGGNVQNDDHITVIVDSQNTRRGASWFFVSANGTQAEELEGGTAGNITWAGDWKAAVTRVEDGWTCEVAIPFRLLRYPKGATSFGIQLARGLARETNPECWPYVPPEGQSWDNRLQYFTEFSGLNPPFFAPRPTFLPYILATGGDGNIAREGMDIKYPLSTTLTGLVTVHPDFRTIEQQVSRINFSYNERFVADRRPFFAEGEEFLPSRELFYSRRIDTLDEGLKIAGKNGTSTIGLVTATRQQAGQRRSSYALNLARDIGQLSRLGFAMVGDNQETQQSNRVGQLFGEYGWKQGKSRFSLNGNYARSWQANASRGGMESVAFRVRNLPGKPGFRAAYSAIAPNFISDLGFVPETDRKGWSGSLFQFNNFDRGPIEFYELDSDIEEYRRHGGGFFRRSLGGGGYMQTRKGYGIQAGMSRESRQADPLNLYHDYNLETGIWWNQRTQFQGGGINISKGKAAGLPSRFQRFQQDILISRPFTVRGEVSRQILGSETTTQTIVTGTYRLDSARTLSGRLVRQDGDNTDPTQTLGVTRGNNFYLAFSQRVRSGSDFFLLLGDPNAPKTRGQVTVKVLRPY